MFHYILIVRIDLLDITAVLQTGKSGVCHTDFFSLINIGSSFHHMQAGGQHFCRYHAAAGAVISKPGDCSGLVVIIPVQAVPCLPFQLRLPLIQDRPDIGQFRFLVSPLPYHLLRGFQSICVFKVKHHSKLRALIIGIFLRLIYRHSGCLAYSQKVVFAQHPAVHLLKKLMNSGSIANIGAKISINTISHDSIRKSLILRDHADHIHTEAIDSLLAPPSHHIKHFIPHLLIFPVQIRLFLREAVQVVHFCRLIILPCGTGKTGFPVVRLLAVSRLLPDIVIPVRIVFGLAALHKPCVFIRCVIHYQIHHNFDIAPMRLGKHPVKILHRAKIRHNVSVVGNIISIVIVGGTVHRREPDDIDPQLLKIGQMLSNSLNIADSIPIAVRKTAGIDLINDRFLPPCFLIRYLHKKPPVILVISRSYF